MVLHLTLVALFLLAPRHHHHHHHFQVSDVDSYDLLATANAMESEGMAAAVADNLQDAGFDDAAADPADTTTFNEEVGGGPARRLSPLSPSPLSLPHLSLSLTRPVCAGGGHAGRRRAQRGRAHRPGPSSASASALCSRLVFRPVRPWPPPRHAILLTLSPLPRLCLSVLSCQIPVDGVTPAEAESPEFQEAIVEAIVEHLDGAVDEDDVQVHPHLGPI